MNNLINLLNKKEKDKIITRIYPENKIIFYEGDRCNKVGILIEGKIEISSVQSNGNKIIYNLINEDEMFGANLIFCENNKYKGNIVTLTKCKVSYINKDELLDILKNNKEFLIEYLNRQSEFSKKLNEKIKLLSIDNIRDRFLFCLKINNYKIEYKTVSELAEQLNTQRETLTRLLSKLEKEKLITRENKLIIYNLKLNI